MDKWISENPTLAYLVMTILIAIVGILLRDKLQTIQKTLEGFITTDGCSAAQARCQKSLNQLFVESYTPNWLYGKDIKRLEDVNKEVCEHMEAMQQQIQGNREAVLKQYSEIQKTLAGLVEKMGGLIEKMNAHLEKSQS